MGWEESWPVIPNHIHFIFGLHPNFGGKPFSFVHYLAVRSAVVVNKPDRITIHFRHEPSGPWWERIKPRVNCSRIVMTSGRSLHFAHEADLLRLEILMSEGGIYLDADTFCINPFTPLRHYNTVLGVEPNSGLCNAVILAERNSEFIREWLTHYESFDGSVWNYHSVKLPYKLALNHPAWIHVEDHYAFFFPSYDDPMCQWLWRNDLGFGYRVAALARIAGNYFRHYRHGAGPTVVWALVGHAIASRRWYQKRLERAFCLHLWESLWWDEHLRDLGPDEVRQSSGLFAALVGQEILDL